MVALIRANVNENGIRPIDPGNQVSKKIQLGLLRRTRKIQFVVGTSISRKLNAIKIDGKVEVSIQFRQVGIDLPSVGPKLFQQCRVLSIRPVQASNGHEKDTDHYSSYEERRLSNCFSVI